MIQPGDALFTNTQQNVLSLLYRHPEKSFYTKEILRKTGMGVTTIKREFDGLVNAAVERFADAQLETLSYASRFDLACNAAHGLALAALRAAGYRTDKR